MTLPITFTPTPKAVDPPPDRANMPLHDETVAAVTLANFEKVNAVLRGFATPVMAQSTCGVSPTTPVTPNVWNDFSAAFWPPVTITVPPGCGAVMIGMGAWARCRSSDITQQLQVSFRKTGTGAPAFGFSQSRHRILMMYGDTASSFSMVIPKASLVVGGTITLTPQFYRGTLGDMTYAGVDAGNLWMLALR